MRLNVLFYIYLILCIIYTIYADPNYWIEQFEKRQMIRHSRSRSHYTRYAMNSASKYDEIPNMETPSRITTTTAVAPINVTEDVIRTFQTLEETTPFNSNKLNKHLENLMDLKYTTDESEIFLDLNDTEKIDDRPTSSTEEKSDQVTSSSSSSASQSNVFQRSGQVDVVTHFLRIVESQHLLGENCTAGTALNLGEGVVDRYAQERFRVEADVAVNRANMLTRLWKYADPSVLNSEYLLHASVFAMVEFDDDIFAAGNCYDEYQYKDYWLFCPYAYRLPEGTILVKDLAVEYKYLSNTSEWFYIARKSAENVIKNYNQFSRGYNTYQWNDSAHSVRVPDEILSVTYEDGKWSKPYYDCGGGNIWMLTYTVPFFGYVNDTYFFKGTSGIDVDLQRVDIDQCPSYDSTQLNIFAASDKCKKRTTQCVALPGLGFRRGSYKCVCRRGFYFPDTKADRRYYNGTVIEEEYEKLMLGEENQYEFKGVFECLACAEGCEWCEDDRPCVVSLNWVMRTALLILSCVIICCLPFVVFFTWKYGNVKVVRAASPVLLRVIALGAFFIYCTTIVMYPRPSVYTCTARVWLREIGFSLTYGALMLKTWRISVIFRVRSAKAVKITDFNLLKRLGVIVAIFTVFLVIRTLVSPPLVIVGRTADDLKAYLCPTDWWDHSFTTLEVIFLVWGIRLCIVVRKAPSEFNESRFISMAIYNEFLLSVFLNISMLFLQSPANPDLLYIIFFCHTQLTVTLLLCLIFGSKAYMVFKGHGKNEFENSAPKTQTGKFVGKSRSDNSHYASTNSSATCLEYAKLTEADVQEEFRRLYTQLEQLKEKNMRFGNRHIGAKITAMQDAATRVATVIEEPTIRQSKSTDISKPSTSFAYQAEIEQLPSTSTQENKVPSGKVSKRLSVSFGPKSQNITEEVKEDGKSTSKILSPSEIHQSNGTTTTMEKDLVTNEHPINQNESSDIEMHTTTTTKSSSTNAESPSKNNATTNSKSNRTLKSGHARTHAIVINLDDKSRFTEEVTV